MEDRVLAEKTFAAFISQALAGEKVFGLQDKEGSWAVFPSASDEKVDVVLFWSDRKIASHHVKAEWAGHRVTKIDLELFVGAWLRGMHEDGYLVGLNWDERLSGIEVAPIEVATRLTEEVEAEEQD